MLIKAIVRSDGYCNSAFNIRKISSFTLISGVGWSIDMLLFFLLTSGLGMRVFLANFLSATLAVTFVYFASVRKTFEHDGRLLRAKFGVYLVYQALSISFFSALIDALTASGIEYFSALAHAVPIASKVVVTPMTLVTNYLFMQYLIEHFRPSQKGSSKD